ncbi:(d)CMP kinase [Sandaracinus amylolyticus]|uniref:Cytidylate kinase n=1 Tax=Sandaracinus amylolyticus TaxID=927083 RepID=A0A0F6W3K8_9BACT|nr:(d)CMP kinase [Sandaracinus amylolyticus]AKF06606.1 Cytidylate kinase [Sandaracinus amylolyticus]
MTPRARGLVVAIDGPAGAGKSTVSRRLAARLGYTLVDTGALYRAIALAAREIGISWDDGPGLGSLARRLPLALEPSEEGSRVIVDGEDRSSDIRTPEISQGASIVSQHPDVRVALLDLQRRLGAEGGVVLEGRDIGTVVFPDAEVKVFLTASDEERARRRTAELQARGAAQPIDQVLAEIRERDRRDSTRPIAPLKPARDAITVDTTALDLDAVVETLVGIVRGASSTRSD